MPIVPIGWVSTEEVAKRVGYLQLQYAGNPLVRRIDYRIGTDWSDDPAVFITVTLAGSDVPNPELLNLAESIRTDLLRHVRTEEIGLSSYLSFVN